LRKKYLFFGPRIYERIYFVEKKGAKCVDFGQGGTVYGPDEEGQKRAIGATLLNKIGKPEKEGLQFWQIALLLLTLAITAKVFGVI